MKILLAFFVTAVLLPAADPVAPPLSKTFDGEVSMVEREVVSLAEAMPAEKYGFVPTGGEFSKSRTFGQQVAHIAAVNYACSAAVLGEKSPMEMGEGENGPASLKTKADIVKFLKDSFAYTHKAMATVTAQNLNDMIASAFGSNKTPRVSMVSVPVWHTFDHYGQMVIYARMNGIVPPASR
jgi:hypothetical protein